MNERKLHSNTIECLFYCVCVCVRVLLRVEPCQPDQQFLWPTLITHNVLLCQVCWQVRAHSMAETVSVYACVCVFLL